MPLKIVPSGAKFVKSLQTIRICKALVMTENLSKTAFSPVLIGPWSIPAGCELLGRGLEPLRNAEIF